MKTVLVVVAVCFAVVCFLELGASAQPRVRKSRKLLFVTKKSSSANESLMGKKFATKELASPALTSSMAASGASGASSFTSNGLKRRWPLGEAEKKMSLKGIKAKRRNKRFWHGGFGGFGMPFGFGGGFGGGGFGGGGYGGGGYGGGGYGGGGYPYYNNYRGFGGYSYGGGGYNSPGPNYYSGYGGYYG